MEDLSAVTQVPGAAMTKLLSQIINLLQQILTELKRHNERESIV